MGRYSDRTMTSRFWHRCLWGGIAALLLLAAAALTAPWWAPGLIRDALQTQADKRLGLKLQVGSVAFTLFDPRVQLKDVRLLDLAGEPALAWAQLDVGLPLMPLLQGELEVSFLRWRQPQVWLRRDAQGQWNWQALQAQVTQRLAPKAGSAEPATDQARSAWVWSVADVEIEGGQLAWEDAPASRRHTLSHLKLSLDKLSLREEDEAEDVALSLLGQLDGAPWEAEAALPSPDSGQDWTLKVQLSETALQTFWAWWPRAWPLRPQGGYGEMELSAALPAQWQALGHATAKAAPADAVPSLSGRVSLRGLAWQEAGSGREVARFDRLDLPVGAVQPLARVVSLGALQLQGLSVDAERDTQGRLNWQGWVDEIVQSLGPEDPQALPWRVSLTQAELQGARLQLRDRSVPGGATLRLDPLEFSVGSVQWPPAPSTEPSSMQLKARWPGVAGRRAAQLEVRGPWQWRAGPEAAVADSFQARLQWRLQGLDLQGLQPYLAAFLTPRLEGELQATGELNWPSTTDRPTLRLAEAQWQAGAVRPPAGLGEPLTWRHLTLSDAAVDPARATLRLGAVRWTAPSWALERSAAGELPALQAWMAPANASAAASSASHTPAVRGGLGPESPEGPDWKVQVGALRVEQGRMQWTDHALGTATPWQFGVQDLHLSTGAWAWPWAGQAAVPVQFRATQARGATDLATAPAQLSVDGQLRPQFQQQRLTQVQWQGDVDLQHGPVHRFMPWVNALAGDLPVAVMNADLGLKLQLQAQWAPSGWSLDSQGQANLSGLSVWAAPEHSAGLSDPELLKMSWLEGRDLVVQAGSQRPLAVKVGQLRLEDFFAKLLVTEQGRLNLQNLVDSDPPEAPVAPAAPAASTVPPWQLSIEQTVVRGGRVDFKDRFVRPNYSADLTELQGTLGRVDTQSTDLAPLELTGRVAGTGLLEIRGSVQPLAQPLALNLAARATDIELPPLSPYGGKYLGYVIDRGKLSVSLNYRIEPDGRLQASNQIVLNQVQLGDKVDSPQATSLPVRFLLSLLADRNGVIDLDLPISGSLNEPQFSLWGLVGQVFRNLASKALSAPLALLSGGGAETLPPLEFDWGSTQWLSTDLAPLKRVVDKLLDKPRLNLTLVPQADGAREIEPLREAQFQARLQGLVRRDGKSQAQATGEVTVPPPGSPEWVALVKRLYREAPLPDKPRNFFGMLKDLPVEEQRARLLAAEKVDESAVRELALRRGVAVRDQFIAWGLPSPRIFLGAPEILAPAEGAAARRPQVRLNIEAP